nr:hypothetical protein BCU22_05495 [Vibrio cyclitrophicus]
MRHIDSNIIKELSLSILMFPNNKNKRRRRQFSRLDPYRLEIMTLHNEINASLYQIQQWLKIYHDITISISGLHKRINFWDNQYESSKKRKKDSKAK